MKLNAGICLLGLFLLPAPAGSNAAPELPLVVSTIQLIATPEQFDGKLVSVIGFIHIGREQDLLFVGEQDFNHAIDENALWFRLNEGMGQAWQKLNRNYVHIVGMFSAKHEGPITCPNGGFPEIRRYAIWSLQSNPIGKALDQPIPKN